ncbi:hypothetical protein HZA44_03570 [Candidatus Peregrinibacteria bacterium]|nr:hypothetical protein [Candidatus Peregrinibacteria bacterium]
MEHQIKKLAEAMTHAKLHKLIMSHVKELLLENNHLIIFVDNAAPLHEMSEKAMDEHLKKGLESVYGTEITYELRVYSRSHEKPDHTLFGSSDKKSH